MEIQEDTQAETVASYYPSAQTEVSARPVVLPARLGGYLSHIGEMD
jgi:hypothetical protein